ncbi:MAG: type II toxin-antitoxin system ParD family antitoxin [Gammaproteobacteria bacterium]|nr:type II toxin-antitoxin system ParD family antitoxin [Gammaproteobacteria bacterium]
MACTGKPDYGAASGGLIAVVRAAMRLLEEREHDFQEKLVSLRQKLAIGEAQLEAGQGVDGETFMNDLIARL